MIRRIAVFTALLLPFMAAVAWWAVLGVCSRAGNLFAGSMPMQLGLYGRLCGLLAALCLLFLLASMGRGRTLERFVPKLWLVRIHRICGMGVILLVIAHFVLIFSGRAMLYDESFAETLRPFVFDARYGSMASAGFLLLASVIFFCGLFVLKKMPFASWKKTHYATYAVILLFFLHQVIYGGDFAVSASFKWFWVALFLLAAFDALWWRLRSLRSRRRENAL